MSIHQHQEQPQKVNYYAKSIKIPYSSYITTDKFYIEPNGKSEVLVIDRISQETSVQGKLISQTHKKIDYLHN